MNKEQVQKALQELQKQPQKKFVQSYDLIINLKDYDVKSAPLDFFANLPAPKGKKVKIAAFVDQQLADQAGKFCDFVIRDTEFDKYKEDKKAAKKLAQNYDYFIAQATIMPKIAAVFGRALGGRGKMPNPKLGCVVPPSANLEPLVKRLGTTVRLSAKKGTNIQCIVGKQDQPEAQLIDNILTVYQTVIKQLPNEAHNIREVLLKTTMGKPIKV
ncbi:MAG TPA: hypothetical protein VJG49_02835 [Candidatus Nanoarchaeia archaeon]|nr:hypothetical protein [Candidatus Nanoarchaeia archaeon]